MLRLSKQTDYGLLALVYLARREGSVVSAREISEFYSLPLPMISKVLKVLHEDGMVGSKRGVNGGYSFDGDPEEFSLGQIVETLEGPWDLVECNVVDDEGHAVCGISSRCPSRTFMSGINKAIKHAFDKVSLGDLVRGVDNESWELAAEQMAMSMREGEAIQQ